MDQSMRESRAAAYFLTHMERLGVDEPEAREGAAVFRGSTSYGEGNVGLLNKKNLGKWWLTYIFLLKINCRARKK